MPAVTRRRHNGHVCNGSSATVHSKLDGLYDAVADGLRTPGLLARIEALEADKAKIAGLPNPPRHRCVCILISQMSTGRQVSALADALSDR